jgi:hemerythrin superfamily protein
MPTPANLPSIADQSEQQLGGPRSVFVRQRRDHARLNELLDTISSTTGDEQDEALTSMCRLVFPHAFAEEAVLWPALRKHLPDGEELTLEVEREHQEINELIAAVDRSRRGDEGREQLIERAIRLLREDVRDEEDELFPRLQEKLDDRQLRRLGHAWALIRATAPTRPHPVVARRPPGNVLSALPLSAIDRSRDTLDRLGRRRSGPAADAARTLSDALAAAAGAIERLPPMRRGEDPSTRAGRTDVED